MAVNTDGSAPANPSLLIAEVDAGAGEVKPRSRAADAEYKHLESETFDTDEQRTEKLVSRTPTHPFYSDSGREDQTSNSFTIGGAVNGYIDPDWSNPHIDLSADISDLEGCLYHEGHIYVGEDNSGGPSTIYKYDTDGGLVDSFTFGSGEAIHTNTLAWWDGELLVCDAATSGSDTTYRVDWGVKEVVGTIEHASNIDGQIWHCIIPGASGPHLLFTEWTGTGAALVDLEGAISDGTTAENVDTVLSNKEEFTWEIQAAEWRNGYLYYTTHDYITKVRFPVADQIGDSMHVTTGEGIVWHRPHYGHGILLEQLTYNPDADEWYIGGDTNVYAARESHGVKVPNPLSNFDVVERGRRHSHSISVDSSVSDANLRWEVMEFQPAIVTAWIYDDGSATNQSYVEAGTPSERFVLAINTTETNGGSEYLRWNPADEWEATGVTRLGVPQWVGFRFVASGNDMKLRISTDYGTTWEDAGNKTVSVSQVSHVGVSSRASSFLLDSFEIEPILDLPP